MNKSYLVLAMLAAFTGNAQAQSNVTVFGSFDGGVRYQNNVDANGSSKVTMNSTGTQNSNRLGFRGTEELGGGLQARFLLESGFNSGNGTLDNPAKLFNRSAFVGLASKWGSVDVGRQYTVGFKTILGYDPFNFKYPLIVPLALGASGGIRFDNDIQYTGTFGPMTLRAEWALGEQAGSGRDNAARSLGLSYLQGPLSFGGSYTLRRPNVAAATGAPSFRENRHFTLGGAYKFLKVRLAGGYAQEDQDLLAGSTRQKNAWFGGSMNLNLFTDLTAAYYDTRVENISGGSTDGKRELVMVGVTYALSKRTLLYTNVDYARFKDGLALPVGVTGLPAGNFLAGGSNLLALTSAPGQNSQTGVSIGISHSF